MKNFNKIFLLLFLINIITLVSCNDDAETVVPTYSMLGEWDVYGYFGDEFYDNHFNFDFQSNNKMKIIHIHTNSSSMFYENYKIFPNNIFYFQEDKYDIIWKSKNHLILRLLNNYGYFELKR